MRDPKTQTEAKEPSEACSQQALELPQGMGTNQGPLGGGKGFLRIPMTGGQLR